MRKSSRVKRLVSALLGVGLLYSVPVFAGEKDNAPSLIYDGKFRGPFDETLILRLYDPKYGVVCYMYLPKFISTQWTMTKDGGGIAFKSFSGNISCVKVGK